jgi:hypothetical protein
MMWDADTAYSESPMMSIPERGLMCALANNRFDKAVKTAIVASAEQLGLPARVSSSAASTHVPTPTSSAAIHSSTAARSTVVSVPAPIAHSSSAAHSAAASASAPAEPKPNPVPSSEVHVLPVHPTGDAVATAAQQRYEKTATAAQAEPEVTMTPDMEPRSAERVKSRFFRL